MVRLHYVTLATKPHPNLDILLQLAEKVGLRPKVLGMSDQRMQSWGEAFGIKIEYILKACAELDDTDVLLYTDAFDIIPLAREREIMNAFFAMDADLVFGAETACHPRQDLRGAFDVISSDAGNRHRYLNAGFSIGYVGAYKELTAQKVFEARDDDQGYWSELFLRKHNGKGKYGALLMKLDISSTIVMNLFDARNDLNYDQASGRYKRISTGARPCFLHLNGGHDDFMQLAKPALDRVVDKSTIGKRLQNFMYRGRFSKGTFVPPLLAAALGVIIFVFIVLALR